MKSVYLYTQDMHGSVLIGVVLFLIAAFFLFIQFYN